MKIHILNTSKVQKAVLGTDDKTYYIPPRTSKSLPSGVKVKEGLGKKLKVTFKESK